MFEIGSKQGTQALFNEEYPNSQSPHKGPKCPTSHSLNNPPLKLLI